MICLPGEVKGELFHLWYSICWVQKKLFSQILVVGKCQRSSGTYKADSPLPKELFPLLEEETNDYLWCLVACQSPCRPPGSLSIIGTSTSHILPYPCPKHFQFLNFHSPQLFIPLYNLAISALCSLGLPFASLPLSALFLLFYWPCSVYYFLSLLWILPHIYSKNLALNHSVKLSVYTPLMYKVSDLGVILYFIFLDCRLVTI